MRCATGIITALGFGIVIDRRGIRAPGHPSRISFTRK
jgi:hypothetical protein